MKWTYLSTVAAIALAASTSGVAHAQSKLLDVDPTLIEENQAAPAPAAKPVKKKVAITKGPAPVAPPPAWIDTLTVDGYIEGGVAFNFGQPFNKLNFGHLYTDRANWPTFNGAVLTAQRPLDPNATGYDFGFKVQVGVGEDMRYNHYLGELDYVIPSRTQIAPIEAHALAHLPWVSPISEGGIDVKVGQFATYNGTELIYAKDNLFYSHSYIFNFGPFFHTGVMVTTHAKPWLDIYTGVTTGVNTSIGWPGDNNASASFHGGFGLNLLDGALTVMGIVHHGPENPKQTGDWLTQTATFWPNTALGCACNPNTANRTYVNLTTTWKATENLTLITDMAYNRESGWNTISQTGLPAQTLADIDAAFGTNFAGYPLKPQGADAYAVAQYASYQVNNLFKVNGRIEYYRDNKNFFVAGFPGYFDAVNLAHGFACPSCIFAGPGNVGTSYLALTAGVTITPEIPKLPIITGLILRPEFRWDTAVNGATPFFGPNGRKSTQGMFNMDVIIPFSLL
ncbi:outer membrane beta-barrel protein [Methylocystis sp. ATCC 49242]|uniref:outer membrane beta-barrel protein n=1 Tax=Methylocystis sp. ATCC 49242 TaxID=622637 RepID=UPI0001F88032|nr:outer membrane beta-barrel protein [Methylocystis sp. ATCC 49242]